MKKKVISAILAGACALSALSFSATAAADKGKALKTTGQVTLKTTVTPATPAISVSIPSKMVAVVNPYGVKVTISDVQYGDTGIASPIYTIRNYTTTSNIKVTGAGSMVVPMKTNSDKSKSPAIDVVTDNKDALYTKPEGKTVLAYVVTKTAGATKKVAKAEEETADLFGTTKPAWAATLPTFEDATVDKTKTGTAKQMVILEKADAKADGSGYEKYSYAQFKLAGDLKFADGESWANEKLTLNLILNITPTGTKATT